MIPGLGRSPGGGHGNPLQYFCLENPHGQRTLVDYSSWVRKEFDTTKPPSTAQHTHVWTCQVALVVKSSIANAGDIRDVGLIPGSGRSPGGGHGNLLQYSCLENPVDRGAWRATGFPKSWTRLSDFTFTFHFHALEKEKATHSSVLAWRIPGTGKPGGLPSMGSHRVGHD